MLIPQKLSPITQSSICNEDMPVKSMKIKEWLP